MASLPVWIAAALAIGAWMGVHIPLDPLFATGGALAALLTTMTALLRADAESVLCRSLGGCVIAIWGIASSSEREARAPPLASVAVSAASPVRVEGTLQGDAVPDEDSVRLRLEVSRLADANAPVGAVSLNVSGELALRRWQAWRAGRTVSLPATVRTPARYLDAGVDDDRLALARRGLVLVGSVKSGALVDVLAQGSWLEERAGDLRA